MAVERAEVLIVGAGPAGLAAAAALRKRGIGPVLVADREPEPGGLPRLCHHTGFGLYDLRRLYSGPSYARRYVRQAERSGAELRPATTITGWQGPGQLTYTSPRGLGQIEARAVLLATGCRERPRSARLVPGSRPQGVFTTGSLQRFVYEQHLPVGRRAVVVGAEIVSLSAVMTLQHAHVPIAGMVTELDAHQVYLPYLPMKWYLMDLRSARIPIMPRTRVSRILGQKRVEGIEVTHVDTAAVETIACDTVIFTGDWIPEHELARLGGLLIDPGSRGPQTDGAFRTSQRGVFAAGNLLRGSETADISALEGGRAAAHIADFLSSGEWPDRRLPLRVEAPLDWIFPNELDGPGQPPPFGHFTFRVQAFAHNADVVVEQSGLRLHTQPFAHLKPNTSMKLDSDWLSRVDYQGEPPKLSIHHAAYP